MFNDDEDSSGNAQYEMKTQMLLVRESSPLQLSAAKKMKTEELAKENEENENATSFEVNVVCLLLLQKHYTLWYFIDIKTETFITKNSP